MNLINIILFIVILLVIYSLIKNKSKPLKINTATSSIPLVYQPTTMGQKEELLYYRLILLDPR